MTGYKADHRQAADTAVDTAHTRLDSARLRSLSQKIPLIDLRKLVLPTTPSKVRFSYFSFSYAPIRARGETWYERGRFLIYLYFYYILQHISMM